MLWRDGAGTLSKAYHVTTEVCLTDKHCKSKEVCETGKCVGPDRPSPLLLPPAGNDDLYLAGYVALTIVLLQLVVGTCQQIRLKAVGTPEAVFIKNSNKTSMQNCPKIPEMQECRKQWGFTLRGHDYQVSEFIASGAFGHVFLASRTEAGWWLTKFQRCYGIKPLSDARHYAVKTVFNDADKEAATVLDLKSK